MMERMDWSQGKGSENDKVSHNVVVELYISQCDLSSITCVEGYSHFRSFSAMISGSDLTDFACCRGEQPLKLIALLDIAHRRHSTDKCAYFNEPRRETCRSASRIVKRAASALEVQTSFILHAGHQRHSKQSLVS